MLTFKKRKWLERIETVRLYYKSPKFALIDLTFSLIALFVNPYRTCRRFLQKKGEENIYAYGETPYSTYEKMVRECSIGPTDTWVEMGAGRGKGCFWLSHFTGCKVLGIEWIPSFVYTAKAIRALFGMKKIQFIRSDVKKSDLSNATVIYLYGLWPDLQIGKGVRVITISEPLEGYLVQKSFWVRFPWGRTRAFLQIALA